MQVVAVFRIKVGREIDSAALIADGDAATAIPLFVAFMLVRRKPTLRFTYGLGRVEDLAGIIIVGLILFSALVAGWQSVDRLINPLTISHLGWVAAAGVIGFIGNEVVAVFRIKVGREIDSAALIDRRLSRAGRWNNEPCRCPGSDRCLARLWAPSPTRSSA